MAGIKISDLPTINLPDSDLSDVMTIVSADNSSHKISIGSIIESIKKEILEELKQEALSLRSLPKERLKRKLDKGKTDE